ncbi:Fur family transcriptional regulator [Rhodovarius lipocyclicus]|uniref:Fur family transcriptional regulator n=1 Tax=Rhodovarius lipocyclicus TaxID=268410 RepID=UPI001357FBE6|nr:Fur family transcriptional regulator [Rhodovarius lipocyclicus]
MQDHSHGHGHAHHHHHAPLDTQLAQAETLCRQRGAQLTPLRRQVLALVLKSENPVGAYALLDQLKAERAGAAPPTVYRALDFLLEQGLIHRVERLNAFVGCATAGEQHAHQFLICRNCGTTRELTDAGIEAALRAAAGKAGFTALKMTVEIEGLCGNCAG